VPVEEGREESRLNHIDLDPFFLSKYEMTCEQWSRCAGDWKGTFYDESQAMLPANVVRWDDCVATLRRAGGWLSLPTEAQWEYACRAGTTAPWSTGSDESSLLGAANIKFDSNDTRSKSALLPVGLLRSNGFGMHDMHGNVWEWCRDEYGDGVTSTPERDPVKENAERAGRANRGYTGVLAGASAHPFRGGDFNHNAWRARSGERGFGSAPEGYNYIVGLRPARNIIP
jgi:formylglycine-generating enzyme required for sulfatase activity